MEKLESPFHIIHGLADTVNDIEGSRELMQRSKSTDKSLKEYEGAWHGCDKLKYQITLLIFFYA